MGTTTVKGAGRRKFEANKRHAQRTPLPPRTTDLEDLLPGKAKPTPAKRARAIVKEEAEKIVAEARADKPARVTKAQALALAAEEAGWDVERIVKGNHKTLIARRGEETLEANWESDKSCVPLGWHTVNGHKAKFQHVTVALKIIATDADVAATAAANAAATRKAPRAVTHKSLAQAVPFNAATASDDEVLAALAGHEVSWRNVTSGGELTEVAIIPLNGKQTKLKLRDLDEPEDRQLTFCDADGGGYRSLRLGQLVSVGAQKDANGHMLTNALHRALMVMKEGRK